MRMDIPWAIARPEIDQITGACKNWFTVQRFVDVSNRDYGVTVATIDAPLVEVGAITAETPWIKTLPPSQTFYSYVMNNYWCTNYRSDQEGPPTFRYSIRPHGKYRGFEASRFGIAQSQPLIVATAGQNVPEQEPLLSVQPDSVIVATLKPSEDGKAQIVRLFNTGADPERVHLKWANPTPKEMWLSNLAEEQVKGISEQLLMAPYEMVTVRATN